MSFRHNQNVCMNNPILSIIIPVYNLGHYLKECLDSIYLQQVDEQIYEIVAIDDGSTDTSLACLKEYAKMHSNLQVKYQENGGVSAARNHALKLCRGKFITFLDGDDALHENSIQTVIDAILHNDIFDIMYCRAFKRRLDEKELVEVHSWTYAFNEQSQYTEKDLYNANFINGGSVCGGIFRKDFFEQNQLHFAEGVANGEDTIFTYLMYARHPHIIFRNIMLTVINVREGSATHDCTMTRVSRLENNLLYLIRQRKLHGKNPSMTNAIDKAAYHSIMLAIEMYLNIATKPSLKDLYNILHIGEICPLHLYDAPLHQRVKSFLINLNFPLCVKLIELENWKNKQATRFRNGGLNN